MGMHAGFRRQVILACHKGLCELKFRINATEPTETQELFNEILFVQWCKYYG